ncbi:hypothetical protein EDB86DRAFT_2949791, partial [Lactarius hatsudake]
TAGIAMEPPTHVAPTTMDCDDYSRRDHPPMQSPSVRTPDDGDDMGLAEGTPHRRWSRTPPTTAMATTRAAMEGIPLPTPAPHTPSNHRTTHHLPRAPSTTTTTTVMHFTHASSAHPRSPAARTPYDDDGGDSDRRFNPMARVATSVCSIPSK